MTDNSGYIKATITPQEWRKKGDWLKLENGYKIFFIDIRKGKQPILFLHGYPTSSYDYSKLLSFLEKDFRLIFIDFLGFGFSDKPRNHNYSLFEQANIVQTVIDHLGIKSINLVSHDMGNSVALELLGRNHPIVEKYIMLNGSVYLPQCNPRLVQRVLNIPIIGRLSCILAPKSFYKKILVKSFAVKPTENELDYFLEVVNYNDGLRVQNKLIKFLNEREVHELTWLKYLEEHIAPFTIIWGQLDSVSGPDIVNVILEKRDDATYIPLETIGHYVQWEGVSSIVKGIRKAFDEKNKK